MIALGSRLAGCRGVRTLGVKPDFSHYTEEEAALIRQAPKIYYPSAFYADIFEAMGKAVFPSARTYAFAQDKIRQTALFSALSIPHPKTRVYFGKRRHARITRDFSFPFIAKIPRGSSQGRGIFLIRNEKELSAYCAQVHAAYIQEYLPVEADVRVVVIGGRPVCSYRRIGEPGRVAANVSAGGRIEFSGVPDEAVETAVSAARAAGFDDVGMDVAVYKGRCFVLEANMKYGTKGMTQAGIDYRRLMERLIADGTI
ncbi:MAG: ATP-grasp domain-containing protein [Deltaproteobacteria bacterium]|nr:ATP-grasp domain-containing protein [Deltaproteobacteria bacterium]